MNVEPPVVKNQEYELIIDDIGINGEGIGRIEGFALFVDAALPGERVRIKALKVGENYGYGKLLDIISSSPDRVKPPCPYARRCGGCQLQHLSYPAQLRLKTRMVRDALERIGGFKAIRVHETIGMNNPWHYRNKGQFPVGMERGQPVIGLYAHGSHNIVDVDVCRIQHNVNDRIISVVKDFMSVCGIASYDSQTRSGVIRHVVSKVGFSTGQVMAIVVTNGRSLPHSARLASMLRSRIPEITAIIQNINTDNTNVVLGAQSIVLWGQNHIVDVIGSLRFRISPFSFFQVNPVQTKVLYAKALEYAGLDGSQTVLDLFSGIGTISLFLASKAAQVYGVEEVPQAVQDADQNARLNNIGNVRFMCGDAGDAITKLPSHAKADVVVLDPPRKGCVQGLLDRIIQTAPARVVYVSCNPATLARDLKYLAAGGYDVVEVQPVDMFPHTVHVETVVLMSRVES